ncbi:hypothetical protein ACLQ2S_20190 [Micromonospora sp. DT48]
MLRSGWSPSAASGMEAERSTFHYDRDFDLLAEVGGARSEWVSPPGTLS